MTGEPLNGVLILDFDGTMALSEFYLLAVEDFVEADVGVYWDRYVAGELTHFEALAAIFEKIRAPEAEVREALVRMDLDPATGETLRRFARCGWRTAIVSAGCGWYIEHLLRGQDIEPVLNPSEPLPIQEGRVEVYTNPGQYQLPDGGLIVSAPQDSRHYLRETGVNKAGVVREALSQSDHVAFAGDGRPDKEAALLVEPERRFARGWLAESLSAEGAPFHPFHRWTEMAEKLLP